MRAVNRTAWRTTDAMTTGMGMFSPELRGKWTKSTKNKRVVEPEKNCWSKKKNMAACDFGSPVWRISMNLQFLKLYTHFDKFWSDFAIPQAIYSLWQILIRVWPWGCAITRCQGCKGSSWESKGRVVSCVQGEITARYHGRRGDCQCSLAFISSPPLNETRKENKRGT